MTLPDLSLSSSSAADARAIGEAAAQSGEDVVNDILNDLEAVGRGDLRSEAATGDATATSGPVVFGDGDEDGFFTNAVTNAKKRAGQGSGANALIVLGVIGVAGFGLWYLFKRRGA